MNGGSVRAVEALLRELFDDAELVRFLTLYYPDVGDALPPRGSFASRVHDAAVVLVRRKHVGAGLFDRLRAERPTLTRSIDAVERGHSLAVDPSPAAAPRRVGRWGVAAFVAGCGAFAAYRWLIPNGATTAASASNAGQDPLPLPVDPRPTRPEAPAPRSQCPPEMLLVTPGPDRAHPPFCLDRTEVSREQFGLECRGRTEYLHGERREPASEFCLEGIAESEALRRPASFMTPTAASAHCRAVGKRLPTDREWEEAARAELGGRTPEQILDFVNVRGREAASRIEPGDFTHRDAYVEAAPVGVLGVPQVDRPSIHDLFGNVVEVVSTASGYRVCGASWNSHRQGSLEPSRCRDERNVPISADDKEQDMGFRCSASPQT